MELVSILINIAIVIFILLGYRQLDKNNRSLEKVKKYSDKVKENLSQFIDEKSADIRNIAIEIKVNLKTHNEILNRIKEEGEKFKAQTSLVIDINKKFQDYDKILKELDHSTLVVEENLKRIQNESAFVDKVGKEIGTAKDKIQKLEKELPAVHNAFEKHNQESLQLLKESIMGTIKAEQETLSQNITAAEKQLKDYAAFMSRLESKKESMEQDTIKNITKIYNGFESNAVAHKSKLETVMNEKIQGIHNTAKLSRDKFEKDLQEIEIKYQRHLQNISDKGIKMEHDALNALKATITENSKQFNSEIDKTFSGLSGVVELKTQEINKTLTGTREAVDQCNAGITNEIDIIKNTFNEKFSHLKTDINAKIEDFILGNREKQKSLTQELAGLNQFSEQKIEKFKTDFTKSIGEISSDLNSFKSTYLEKIKEAALAGEVEKEKLVHIVSSNLDNTRKVLTKNIQDLQADVDGVEKLKEAINARIEETNETFRINNKQIVQRIDVFKTEVEKEISHSTKEMETRVLSRLEKQLAEFESVSCYRIKKIEESNLDIENLEKNINDLLETRKEDITRNFNEYAAGMEQKRIEEETHTREIILNLTTEIKTLENTLLELKTKAYQAVSEKLKVFEDEFFSGLKSRSDKMETSVLNWQADVEQTLERTKQKYTAERQLVEDSYIKELDNKVEALKKKGETSIQQLLEFIKSEHLGTKEYAKKLSADIEKVCSDIKIRYTKMKENAGQENKAVEEIIKGIKQDVYEWKKKFNEDISAIAQAGAVEREKTEAAYGKELDKRCTLFLQNTQKELAGINDKVKAGKDQITGEFDDFRKKVESTKTSIQDFFTENEKKINAWQSKLDAATGSYLVNYDKELAALKKNLGRDLETITQEFTKQREELILAAAEERVKTGAACSKETEKHYTALFQNSQAEIAALGVQFNTIQAQLLAEYEEFKKKAQGSRNEIQGIFAENDKKIASWQTRIDVAANNYMAGFDKELTILKKNTGKELETLSREFVKQREELVLAANEERAKTHAACCKEIEKQYNTLMQSSRADIAALGSQFSTAREQILGEFEELKKNTQLNKNEILNICAENDEKTNTWQSKIDTAIHSSLADYDKELASLKKSLSSEIDKQRNAFLQSSQAETTALGNQLNTVKQKILGEFEELKKAAQLSKNEILGICTESDKKTNAWQAKIDTTINGSLVNLDKELAALKKNISSEIDKQRSAFLQSSQAETAALGNQFNTVKQKILGEFEELKKTTQLSKNEILGICTESDKKTNAWQAKIDAAISISLVNLDKELAALKKTTSSEIEKQRSLFQQSSQADLETLGSQSSAARAQIIGEYEELKKTIQLNKNEFLNIFGENDKKMAVWQSKIDVAINSSLVNLDKELAALKKNISSEIEKQRSALLQSSQAETAALGNQLNTVKQKILGEFEELKKTTQLSKNEIMGICTESDKKTNAWQSKIDAAINSSLVNLDKELAVLKKTTSSEIEKQRSLFQQSSQADLETLGSQSSAARAQIIGEYEELKKAIQLNKNEFLNIFGENDKKMAAWQSKIDAAINSSLVNLDKELAALKKTTSSEIEKQRSLFQQSSQADLETLGSQSSAARAQIIGEYEELKKATQLNKNEILNIFGENDKKMAAWQSKIDAAINGSLVNLDKELAALKKNISSEIEKQRSALLQGSQAETAALGNQFNTVKQKILGEFEELRKTTQLSKNEIMGICTESDKKTNAWQSKIDAAINSSLANLDKELAALKKTTSSEIEKQRSLLLQSSQADLETLGSQSSAARAQIIGEYEELKKVTQLNKNEILNIFGENDKKMAAWQSKIDAAINSSLVNLDKELAALKKTTSSEIEKQRSLFQQSSQADLETLGSQSSAARAQIIGEYEELKKVTQLNKNEILNIFGENDKKMAAWQSKIDAAINSSLVNLDKELAVLKKTTGSEIEKQRSLLLQSSQAETAALGNQLNAARDKILGEYEELKKNTQLSKNEILNIFAENDEKMAAWQSRIDTTISSSLAGLNKEIAGLKKSMSREIDITAKEFTKQREDLVLATSEERGRIKGDLKDFSTRLDEFNNGLKNRTKEIFEEFNSQYTNFKTDVVNSINGFQQETQERIVAFKKTLQDNNAAVQEIQKTNMQKFETEYKTFRDKLKVIENQQHNFVEQTKLFERADKLRILLKTSIEELKNDISRLEPEHQKMHAVEAELNKTKQAAEEINGKLARFFAEKRRIDSMEKDFSKLIRISDDIGIKLDNVTATKDILQEIQLKMRDLEKLENDIDTKYDRLEKKNDIIEKTSKGIDKNFQSLETIHANIKNLDSEYQALQPKMLSIKQELKFLTENKPRTDAVFKKIVDLSTVLKDIEQRMEKLQTAREWLSRTETRLENISKEAGEQVKLMQSIVKAEADTDKKRSKGAPPQDIRETVVKLANQGWSVKEISKATNISQGEVELILELAPAKR